MKKYEAQLIEGGFAEVYLASDVEAEERKMVARIVELEEALKQREEQLRVALDQQRSDH